MASSLALPEHPCIRGFSSNIDLAWSIMNTSYSHCRDARRIFLLWLADNFCWDSALSWISFFAHRQCCTTRCRSPYWSSSDPILSKVYPDLTKFLLLHCGLFLLDKFVASISSGPATGSAGQAVVPFTQDLHPSKCASIWPIEPLIKLNWLCKYQNVKRFQNGNQWLFILHTCTHKIKVGVKTNIY
jgi:hypothetical protein